ncbi:MAG: tRNA preQ1(34) S-adenosylmethionine ribosyltransferase-isomerase QueA [Defluviitaleaceae bacterium]|nr:tRNA preQ1(34) S-adenosylmethionine ribosyltransferase-isomerase QueA [Defluviitaleaceae bacterium]MCL2262024.1 tRNA preQ1(34) S-adenosylmethionine ribosyltransferase-isomerase QueA [Defluviitaleaceae bacterium]
MLEKKDFYYDLPKELIAQQPLERRDGSRLMRLCRKTGAVTHTMFKEIKALLNPGDCIVINDSKVIPARLLGRGESGSAEVEMLLHERLDEKSWSVLVKPGRKAKEGDKLIFGDGRLVATVKEIIEDGLRVVEMAHEGDFEPLLEEIGEMPLPHYIEEKQEDTSRYNTVYAKNEGSVAAPTAGLHFTNELLDEILAHGVKIARVTLHVGIGTFRPVKEDDITKHHMHSEYCRVEPEVAALINETKKNGNRVIAIGTTSCRTIESRADDNGMVLAGAGKTDIFIYPGYEFKVMDGLLTNFHLPESTLIMLVSAFAGREATLAAYQEAVREEYRFFSYGDAMLLV